MICVMVCDKNCEKCPYPDCINDDMDLDDYAEASKRDEMLGFKSTGRRIKSNSRKKNYYATNRDKCLARCKEHYLKNKEKYKAYRTQYYQDNKERILLRQLQYDRKRRRKQHKPRAERWDNPRRYITYARHKRNMIQRQLATACGLSVSTIWKYESGCPEKMRCWDAIVAVMPEIEELRHMNCHDYCDWRSECTGNECYLKTIHLTHNRRMI